MAPALCPIVAAWSAYYEIDQAGGDKREKVNKEGVISGMGFNITGA